MILTDVGVRASRRMGRLVRRRLIARRLRAGLPLRPGPSWVQVGIDERCNYRCPMCSAHSYLLPRQQRTRLMPPEAFRALIAELSELGTQRLDIAGSGEPLLHPEALDLLRDVKAAGMRAVLMTNGSLLTPETCDRFIEMGLDALNVSLNAATDHTHRRVAGAPPGDRARILAMLRYLVERRNHQGARRPFVSVSFVVQRDNHHEIAQIARQAIEVGLDCLLFMALGVNAGSRALVLSDEQEREAHRQLGEALRVLTAAGCRTNVSHYLARQRGREWSRGVVTQTPCTVPQLYCRIHADGSVDPCGVSRRVVGDVTRARLGDIWSSPAYCAFRREAFRLPAARGPLEGCGCYTCNHAQTLLYSYQRLRRGLWPEIP